MLDGAITTCTASTTADLLYHIVMLDGAITQLRLLLECIDYIIS